ncbi:MAG TPA: protoporphyrinogen oxidase [Verrucomicrobiae bacterium]|nr:protoporphyrinogen oxidase [Verrucomicrobiae bacterium]
MDPSAASSRRHVVVVGAGITGLAAAHRLGEADGRAAVRVTVLEATDRIGGKIETGRCGEWTVELGPDGFLARDPDATELCRAVGLGDLLVPAQSGRAGLWSRGRIRWLPTGLVLGVPVRVGPLRRARVLSPLGLARVWLEPLVPPRPVGRDDPLGPILRRRLGRQAFDRLVDPLLSGIYAGSAEGMSLGAVAPRLLDALQEGGSLRRGLRRQALLDRSPGGAGAGAPTFLTVAGGLSQLVDRLAGELAHNGLRSRSPATAIHPSPGGGWVVVTGAGTVEPADAVIIATPAAAAAALLAPVNPAAAACLADIPYASVATVTLAYPASALPRLPEASGFLVPRGEGRRVTACTFLGSKWPHLDADDVRLVRASVGRHGDRRALDLSDAQLAAEVHLELRRALGVGAAPHAITVRRWRDALPQYRAGHLGRMDALELALGATPGLHLAGAALRGVGLPACIRQGRAAADRAVAATPGRPTVSGRIG